MIKRLWKRADLCWIISLIISCTIIYITIGLLFLFFPLNPIIGFILGLLIQLIAIILACRAFIISQTDGQFIIAIICTVFANISFILSLFIATIFLGLATAKPFLS